MKEKDRMTTMTVTLPSPLLMRLIKKARTVHKEKRAVSKHVRGLIEKDLQTA